MSCRWQSRHIGLFLVLLVVFTGIGATLAIVSGNLFGANGYYTQLIMWSPGVAAVLTALVAKRPLSAFGWKWGLWKWQVFAWLTPLAYMSIAYAVIWGMGWGRVPNPEFLAEAAKATGLHIPATASALLMIFFNATLGMAFFGGALGEEIGWRGFLVPALFDVTNRKFTATALINAAIWACWHAPIIFFSSYNNPGVPRWYSFACFVILNIGGATITDWFRLRSGSLWTGVLLHTAHNIFVQDIFTPLTANTGKTQYFIDEFGIVLPIVMLAFAIYFWTRRKELTGSTQAESATNEASPNRG